MSDKVIAAVIGQQTKQLKLPGIGRAYVGVGRQARDEGWPHEKNICVSYSTPNCDPVMTEQRNVGYARHASPM